MNKRENAFIAVDATMSRIIALAERIARANSTVLIQGESGTGKEVLARFIHEASGRKKFIAINCAALPSTLLESELFGHEKGAFTGAFQKRVGKFELADKGTLLLDEISEMDLLLQAKLLRVIQEREVDRVGGDLPISVDVRIIATTNRSLEQMIREGTFRQDLYYRLNVISLVVPPLRERRLDIKPLLNFFMKRYLGSSAPQLVPEVLQVLTEYNWPGNIRELHNAVERAAVLSGGLNLHENDFFPNIATHTSSLAQAVEVSRTYEVFKPKVTSIETNSNSRGFVGKTVNQIERELILETLTATKNNRSKAAKMLGISIRTLRNKLREYSVA
jgi:two-component system, response regulator FlrC